MARKVSGYSLSVIPHSIVYFLVRAANGILAMATLATLTRLMPAKDYGGYTLGLSAATIGSTVLFQWLSVATGRFYPAHRSQPALLLCTVNRIYWIVALVVLTVTFITWVSSSVMVLTPAMLLIIALMTVTQGRFNLILQLTNACEKPLQFGLLSCMRSLIALVASASLVYVGMGVSGALSGALAGFGVASLCFVPHSMGAPFFGRADAALAAQLFRYGFPFTLTFFAILVVDVADRFLISMLLGLEKVAPYAAAYDLTQQTIGVIINVLFLAAFPRVVSTFERDGIDAAKQQMQTLGRRLLFVGLAAVAGLGVLANDVTHVLLGQSLQQDAALIIPWIAVAIMVAGFKSYYLDIPFQLAHATGLQASTAVLMALINLGLNWLLILPYGILGAAWATLIAFVTGAAVSAYCVSRIFPLPKLWNDLGKTLLAVVPMVGTLLLLPPTWTVVGLVCKLLLGMILYLVTAWFVNLSECRNVMLWWAAWRNKKHTRHAS